MYAYVEGNPLSGTDPSGLVKCIRLGSANTAGCGLISKEAKDTYTFLPPEETNTDMVDRYKLPDYEWGVKGQKPSKKLPFGGPPIKPTYELRGFFVFELWFTESTIYKQLITDFTEKYKCIKAGKCANSEEIITVTTRCFGDKVPSSATKNFWWRNYYEAVGK
jgi:hypothetical protein